MATLRLHLPPNLVAAASRGAVPIRVEFDGAAEPEPALLPALALLQSWCGTPKPPAFIELSRMQLRELASACGRLPVFVEGGAPGPWAHADLVVEPPAPAVPADPVAMPKRRAPAGEPLTVDGSEHYLAISLPSREHPSYAENLELLKSLGFVLEPSNRKWWLRDRHKTLNFLAVHGERLRESGARFTPNFESRTKSLSHAEVTCETSPAKDGWDVSIGLGGPSESAVRDAVAAGRSYAESDGRVVLIDPERLHRVQEAQRALAGPAVAGARASARVSAARLPEVEDLLGALAPGFKPPDEWARRSEGLRMLSKLEPAPALASVLRPYQRLGAAWLWHLHRSGLGGVLADEMGLGKTLQALALIASARGGGRTHVVVCPASLAENWRREAARFAPGVRVFVHHGSERLADAAAFSDWDLVITSYGTLCRDADLFSAAELGCVIGDEGQHIKNPRSQNAKAMRGLRAQSRFVLTGTPVENSLDDLRSIFDFVLPGYLDPVPQGARGEERGWHDGRLRAKVAHYILRRTKAAVAPELPARIEQVVWCAMEPGQAQLYRS
ncbi:MAG TPA: SNF2-related protein, partial [Opitutaceae bacterium]